MADKKKKPALALVISVGPKMKTKPTDAATPDMKKYGSMPMKKAWDMLKGERGGMPRNFKRTRIPPKPMRQAAPEAEPEPEIPTPQKVAAAKQQFDFINNIRRKRGEPPISIDEHLQQAGLTLEDYDREYHPEALE